MGRVHPAAACGMIDGMRIEDLIHDWNAEGAPAAPRRRLQFDDETLRDGLQSPAVSDPPLDQKLELLGLMDRLGIHTANLGLPGAGGRPREDILAMARHISSNRLRIGANVACRTVVSDIEPVVEMTQRAGMPIEVCAFIGSSYIRQYAEDWTLDMMLDNTRKRDTEATLMNATIYQWRYGQAYGDDLFKNTAAALDGWRQR